MKNISYDLEFIPVYKYFAWRAKSQKLAFADCEFLISSKASVSSFLLRFLLNSHNMLF